MEKERGSLSDITLFDILAQQDWREILESSGIRVTNADEKSKLPQGFRAPLPIPELNGLVCASYDPRDPRCDYAKTFTRQCRGIVFDKKTKQVYARPFDKFGNWFESYAADIDWESATAQEKVDGQLIKLWNKDGRWIWSTNRRANADLTPARLDTHKTTLDLIQAAENFSDLDMQTLDEHATYLFELTSPYNQVVIHYRRTLLTHIGTRDTLTGVERDEDIGIPHPRNLGHVASIKDCLEMADSLNKSGVTAEGFVIVDAAWDRIKVKNKAYLDAHHAVSRGTVSPKTAYVALIENDEELLATWAMHPTCAEQLKTYRIRYARACEAIQQKAAIMRQTLNATHDRAHAFNTVEKGTQQAIAAKMAFDGISLKQALAKTSRKALVRAMEENL